jgi:HSP20 family protein
MCGRLMSLAFGDLGLTRFAGAPWSPMADVAETDDAYLVHVELPGIRRDQVDVQLLDRELVIRGDIKEEEEDGKRRSSSRRTGRFEYRTYLPGDVKADQVSAQLSDGVLTVTVPKSEAAKPRRIEVTTSQADTSQAGTDAPQAAASPSPG